MYAKNVDETKKYILDKKYCLSLQACLHANLYYTNKILNRSINLHTVFFLLHTASQPNTGISQVHVEG